jgi:hypothetical protein
MALDHCENLFGGLTLVSHGARGARLNMSFQQTGHDDGWNMLEPFLHV